MSHLLCLTLVIASSGTDLSDLPECGPSCVYDVLKCYGRDATIDDVLARFKRNNPAVDYKQVTFLELTKVFDSYGLHCLALEFDPHDFAVKDVPTPAILHLTLPDGGGERDSSGHYIVLHSINDSTVIVYDPAPGQGRRTADLAALRQVWTGRLLYVSPETIIPPRTGVRLIFLALLAVQLLLAGVVGRRWLFSRG